MSQVLFDLTQSHKHLTFEQYYFACFISPAEYYFSSPHYRIDEGVGVDTQVTLTVKRTGVLAERTIGNVSNRLYQRERTLLTTVAIGVHTLLI